MAGASRHELGELTQRLVALSDEMGSLHAKKCEKGALADFTEKLRRATEEARRAKEALTRELVVVVAQSAREPLVQRLHSGRLDAAARFAQSPSVSQSVARNGRRSAKFPALNSIFMVVHLFSMSCAFSSLRAMVVGLWLV